MIFHDINSNKLISFGFSKANLLLFWSTTFGNGEYFVSVAFDVVVVS
jgi:hypothetical protein